MYLHTIVMLKNNGKRDLKAYYSQKTFSGVGENKQSCI